jgi:hypothetical protein
MVDVQPADESTAEGSRPYQYQMLQLLTDPNTGAAWTLPAVNAAEFGIKITN